MPLAILNVVRREHRLRHYKKKEGLSWVTVVKHRVILLLVGFEAKRIRGMFCRKEKKRGVGKTVSQFEACNDLSL